VSREDDREAVQVASISLQVGSTLSSRVELTFLHNQISDQITDTAAETWTTTSDVQGRREKLSMDSAVRYKRGKRCV